MGLFDRSKQVVTTTNNISSTDINSTESTNIQDSNNTVTSITDAFKSSVSWVDSSVFSQPIAIMAGGASASGFDANEFFDSGNAVAGKESGGQLLAGSLGKFVIIGLVILVAFYLWKKRK